MMSAFDTPWKVSSEIWRWLAYPYIRMLFFINGIPWGKNWRIHGAPIIQKHRLSQMSFGAGLGLRSTLRSNPLGLNHPVVLATLREGAVISAGDYYAMSGGALCSAKHIAIGNDVTVGANTIIADTDFHPLSHRQRETAQSKGKCDPVRIEDGVFIGTNCLILKGVTLGACCVIGAGSVVTRSVPPFSIAGGNPARVLSVLEH